LRKNNPLHMCLLIPLLLSMGIVQVGASGTVVSVGSYTAQEKGDVFTINVTIANVVNLQAFEYKFKWDATVINLTSYTTLDPKTIKWGKPPAFGSPFTFDQKLFADYPPYLSHYFSIVAMAGATPFNGSITLATYTFKVINLGSCVLDLYDVKLGNSTAGRIPHTVEDGEFKTLAQPAAAPFPIVNVVIVIVTATIFVVALYYVIRRLRK